MGLAHGGNIVSDGLVLCLDAWNVRSYPGSGSVWSDLSGENKNVNLVTNTFDSEGKAFNYNFNNSGPNLIYGGLSEMSVEILFKTPSNFTGNSQQLTMYPVGNNWGILTSRNLTHTISVALKNDYQTSIGGTLQTWYYGYRDTNIGNNEWCHFIFTYNGNNTGGTNNVNMVNAYINNQKNINRFAIHTGTNMSTTIGGPTTLTAFSRFSNSGQKFAIIRIYNKQLTDQEVKQNYLATKGRFGL
jgi:hypothetical protein